MKRFHGSLAVAVVLVAAVAHANAPAGRYTASGGSVTDNVTGLVWQQMDDGMVYTWANARTHCSGLGANWRLPTANELQTLVDDSVASPGPTIDPTFTNTGSTGYWSSSLVSGSPSNAWYVNFPNGNTTTLT